MNYVFEVEFVELNGILVHRHRMQKQNTLSRDEDRFGDDPARDRGMEGSAMLSRYPIRDATVIRLPSEYDWYHGEIKALGELQRMQKWSSEKLFDERIKRQVRRGGRIALLANIEVPQSPAGVITIVCPHLEDYTEPRGRRSQADYLLQQLSQISNPVIVAGDFNTMGHNAHPQTFKTGLSEVLNQSPLLARARPVLSNAHSGSGLCPVSGELFQELA
jgi:endonuclease/exonuclease/phosphatase family metal-dependent hydrolase